MNSKFLARVGYIPTIKEIVFFSESPIVIGSEKLYRKMLDQHDKKEVHDKVKPEIFVNNDIYERTIFIST